MHEDIWTPESWKRDDMVWVLMQYIKFEQNFNMWPFPMQVKEQAQAESVLQ